MSDTTERVAPTKQIIQILQNWSELFGFADEQSRLWLQQAMAQAQEDAEMATEPEFALGIEYEATAPKTGIRTSVAKGDA